MALLNAPEYNERGEKLKKQLLLGSGALVVLLILLTLAGYLSGHGWFFTNLPAEHKVDRFFLALEAKDYPRAYAIYTADPAWQQNPGKHTAYPIQQFTEDWTSESPIKAPITSHHVDISRTEGEGKSGGTIVAVTLNGLRKDRIFMRVEHSDGSLTWPAVHEIEY